MALEYFAQYRIVGFLGHRALASSMISTQIPTANLDNTISRVIELRDSARSYSKLKLMELLNNCLCKGKLT